MGALLLIIVVVVAVASLASFVAIAQTNAQNRNQFLTNVKNDNLQVTFAQFNVHFKALNPLFSMRWDNMSLTIRNSNTQPSRLSQIKIGNLWASNWNQLDGNKFVKNLSSGLPAFYGRGVYLDLPAKGTVSIFVGFNSTYHQVPTLRNASMSVTLLSVVGNFFTTVYNPPSALGLIGVSSVSYQYYNRDVVTLDGSQSLALNQSKITAYSWYIKIPLVPFPTKGSCNLTALSSPRSAQSVKVQVMGKITQFFQESARLSNGTGVLGTPHALCLTGPFKVSFSALDSRGLVGNFSSIVVVSDPNMVPISTITASATGSACLPNPPGPGSITVSVTDIFGRPVSGATVLTSVSGSFTPAMSPSYTTNGAGQVSIALTSCTAQSKVAFTVNSLPPATVSYA